MKNNILKIVIVPLVLLLYSCNDNIDALITKKDHHPHLFGSEPAAAKGDARGSIFKSTNYVKFYQFGNGGVYSPIELEELSIHICTDDWWDLYYDDSIPHLADRIEVMEKIDGGCDCETDLHKSQNYLKLHALGYTFEGFPFNGTSWFSWTNCYYRMSYHGDLPTPYIVFTDGK